LAFAVQFNVERGFTAVFVRGVPAHNAYRFASKEPLSDGSVQSCHSGEKCMISLAMFDDQELAVSPERSRERNTAFVRRNDLGADARFERPLLLRRWG